jgi:hypothetical protein
MRVNLEKYEQNKEWQRKGATLSDKTAAGPPSATIPK